MKTKIEKKVEKIFYWKEGNQYVAQICYNNGSAIIKRFDTMKAVKDLAKENNCQLEEVK